MKNPLPTLIKAARRLFPRADTPRQSKKHACQNPFLPRRHPTSKHFAGRNTLGSDLDPLLDAEARLYAARRSEGRKFLDEIEERLFLHEFPPESEKCIHCGATLRNAVLARGTQGPAFFAHVCPKYAQQVFDRFLELHC